MELAVARPGLPNGRVIPIVLVGHQRASEVVPNLAGATYVEGLFNAILIAGLSAINGISS